MAYMSAITKYGLRHKNSRNLLGVETSSNGDSDFSGSFQVCLTDSHSGGVWLVDSLGVAEQARVTNTPWYNAGYNTPSNYYAPEDLEVVVVDMNIR